MVYMDILFYEKDKVNKEFSNHFIRKTIYHVWKKIRKRWFPQIPLWVSINEAPFKNEKLLCEKWPTYEDLTKLEKNQRILKTEEELFQEGYICNWILYRRIKERFNQDMSVIGKGESEFEQIILQEGTREISKIYQLLLKQELEEESLKNCMIRRAQDLGQNIQLTQWEKNWTRRIKYTKNYVIRENLIKMQYRWYLAPEIISKMSKNCQNKCWKCKEEKGT